MRRPLLLSMVALGLLGQDAPHSLEDLPQLTGARRNPAEEVSRAQSQRPPYCAGPAQGALGEALGGQTLRKRRFQILASPSTPAQLVAFYQKTLAAKPGELPERGLGALKVACATPVHHKRYTSGGGFVSHHFRWVARRGEGDLASFEIVVEQPRPARQDTLVVQIEAVYAADRPVAPPTATALGTQLHPGLHYDLNGSSRLPGQVFHRFEASLPLEALSRWYEERLQRPPSRADDRHTFLLSDRPGDYSRMLVLRALGEGGCEAVFVVPGAEEPGV